MARYSKNKKASPQTVTEAEQIAKATQRPGQTKEQTKLIAQGIQKGIEQYKKKQKAKSRELNKKQNKLNKEKAALADASEKDAIADVAVTQVSSGMLPWVLLAASWLFFLVYIFVL